MGFDRFASLAGTALKSNFVSLKRPYKLNYAITMMCQSRCLTCVKPDERILGDNKPISELKINDQAIGATGLNRVSQVFARKYSGPLVRIKASGLLPIEITPEHPILVTRSKTLRHSKRTNGKNEYYRTYEFDVPSWKKAKDIITKNSLNDGDYVCTPIMERKLDITELDLKEFTKGRGVAISKAKGFSLKFPLNSETAWLLGIYTAEGCPASNGSRFSLNANEINLQEKIERIAVKLGYSVSKTTRNNCTSCCLSSHVISRAFADWCGTGALNKKIPDFILLNKDDSILKAFLEGWEVGDGYSKDGIFTGSTISKTLALQLQLAYTSLGTIANISHVKKTKGIFNGKVINLHDAYVVKYLENSRKNYSRKIGKYLLHPIRDIKHVQYEGTVHNIETEDNTYLVSNMVVHNCNIWEIKPKDELRIEEIREFAAKNNYFKWIELTGGEPFLRSDIVEIARAFAESSKDLYLMTMPTNSLCNPETEIGRIKEILSLGIPRVAITISLDGHKELHDKIRGIPGTTTAR